MKSATKRQGATSYKETAFGIIPRSKLLKLEIEGTKKGLNYISGLLSPDNDFEITPELILTLHRVSFGWIFPKWAGKYRIVQVTISGKETPPYYKIPEMVLNLCRDLDERLKQLPEAGSDDYIVAVVKILAWFQHGFVSIHPFQDYNGRIARMCTVLLLLKLDLPPAEIKVEKIADRKQYIIAMQKADNGDISFLENIISKTVSEELKRITTIP